MFRRFVAKLLEEFGDDILDIIKDKLSGRTPAQAQSKLSKDQEQELNTLLDEVRTLKQESDE